MSKKWITKIVPPVVLCKKIPKGSFEDSALKWAKYGNKWILVITEESLLPEGGYAPAPTYEEVLEEMLKDDVTLDRDVEGSATDGWSIIPEHESEKPVKVEPNLATLYLKEWLKVKKQKEN